MGGNSEVVGTDELKNGRFSFGSEPISSIQMGHVVSEQNCGNSERGDRAYQSQSDRNARMVRRGVGARVEAHLSLNSNKHQIRTPCTGPSCLAPHTQPVVEVPHGCSSGLDGGIGGVKQAVAAISCAPLGRIELDHPGKEAGGFQRSSHGSYGESPNSKAHPNSCSSAEMQCTPLLQGGHNRHSEIYDDMETRLDGVQGYIEEDGMEYGGNNCNEY